MEKTNRVQLVRSKPERVLVESYLSPKGIQMLAILAKKALEDDSITPKLRKHLEGEIRAKYTKNRYAIDPESRIIKGITHPTGIRGNVESLKVTEKEDAKEQVPVETKKKKGLLSSLLTALLGVIFIIFRR